MGVRVRVRGSYIKPLSGVKILIELCARVLDATLIKKKKKKKKKKTKQQQKNIYRPHFLRHR